MNDIAEFDTPEGKVRLEVECDCPKEEEGCSYFNDEHNCCSQYDCMRYRPMTKQEIEELHAQFVEATGEKDIAQMIACQKVVQDKGMRFLNYKGQRVRVGK